ncbi:hypothetical protein BVG16_29445 [Paenibacillus selenitireducens]|uniref:Hemerythrin-like domain-containing protein n=1 Tax=Paenibacillus selenitireducens TaxID=1324314 RepID=A0A1T2X0C7_9BACL|nr:hemerythrin domain-containing protein [Paenibacillus selenitireducens]OPA73328.1 hypothetical protein BVG16_29445 [Paenibacillus selenitireducens]
MSGRALKNVDSHSSIHEAALEEAKELVEILHRCLTEGEHDKALEVAYINVEHWETRTLQHAESEEGGLYKEVVEANAELRETVAALTRDHNLMRYLVRDIKEMLENEGASDQVLQRFYALILIDTYHNHDEETMIGHEMEAPRHASGEAS